MRVKVLEYEQDGIVNVNARIIIKKSYIEVTILQWH